MNATASAVAETLDLGLKLPAPDATPEQVEQLMIALRAGLHWPPEEECNAAAGWMTATQLAAQISGWTDRKVRKVAAVAAPAVVSYPGSPGYKLWAACTVEEINHAIEAMEAQAGDMIKRAQVYRLAYHRRFRGTVTT